MTIGDLKNSRPVQVVRAYGESQASNYANGMALAGFLAMFPLILGILSIIGLVLTDPALQAKAYEAVASIFPADAHREILSALQGVKRSAGLLGIVSVAGLLWGGTSMFASMEFALTRVFGTKQRDTLRQRLMGLVMVLVFLAAVLVAIAANSLNAAAPPGTISTLAAIGGGVIGAVVLVGLLVAIYRFVPNRTFAVREVLPGAVLAGVGIEGFSLLFPLYARLAHGFNTYGQQFALFFLLATWMTFLSQFILLGAVFNKVRLGVPDAEGIAPAPDSEGRDPKEPAAAIEHEQGRSELVGRRPATTVHPDPREARIALGVGAVAAAVGAVIARRRQH
jgi:membrane protein